MQTFALRFFKGTDSVAPTQRDKISDQGVFQAKTKRRFSRKYWMIEAIKLSLLYLALSPLVAMPLYNTLAFFPDKQNYDATSVITQMEKKFAVTKTDVYFPSRNGKVLHGWLFRNPHSSKVAVFSHGNGGNIAHRLINSMILLKNNLSVLLYDYEGYGTSQGEPTIENIRDDGLAAYDYIVNKEHFQPKNIIVFGESIGTGVAAYTASLRPVNAIILVSGYTSLIEAGAERLPWLRLYPKQWFPGDLDNLSVVTQKHAPLLLIHGAMDVGVPTHFSREMFAQAVEPKQLIIIPGRGHNDVAYPETDLYNNGISNFLTSLPSK